MELAGLEPATSCAIQALSQPSYSPATVRVPRSRVKPPPLQSEGVTPIVSRGFRGRRRDDGPPDRVPPGQYVTDDFPVLSAWPTARRSRSGTSTIVGEVDELSRWMDEFRAFPSEEVTVDIHCVTKWSKLDTTWEGVRWTRCSRVSRPQPSMQAAFCGRLATRRTSRSRTSSTARPGSRSPTDGEPLDPEHGGPARLLVPHLYFWKSAKWVRGLQLASTDEPGFWEQNGYHLYVATPWREQRYWGD